MLNNEAPVTMPPSPPPCSTPDPAHLEKCTTTRHTIEKHTKATTERIKERWDSKWKTYQNRIPRPTEAQLGSLSRTRLKIHNNLMKAESALTTQIRTEKIGLANFLFNRRVPGVMTPACSCGWQKQTAKHIILHCRLIDGRYEVLKQIRHQRLSNDHELVENFEKTNHMDNKSKFADPIFTSIATVIRVITLILSRISQNIERRMQSRNGTRLG